MGVLEDNHGTCRDPEAAGGCDTSVQSVPVHVLNLPDHVLLKVFGYVRRTSLKSASFLLGQVGAVCSRWLALSRDPCLWRGANLEYTVCDDALLEAKDLARVLAAVPCLRRLKLHLHEDEPPFLLNALSRSSCPIAELDIRLEESSHTIVLDLLKPRTATLRSFRLESRSGDEVSNTESNWFWSLLDQMESLEELSLTGALQCLLAAPYEFEPRARSTLQVLTLYSTKCSSAVATLVLAHKETLKCISALSTIPPSVFHSIGQCKNLLRASLPAKPQMESLQLCERLKDLSLAGNCSSLVGMRFTAVTNLHLFLCNYDGSTIASLADVFPQLRFLSLSEHYGLTYMMGLRDVVRGFPYLQVLCVDEFSCCHLSDKDCILDKFEVLVTQRPLLHITMMDSRNCKRSWECHRTRHPHLPGKSKFVFVNHVHPTPCEVCDQWRLNTSSHNLVALGNGDEFHI